MEQGILGLRTEKEGTDIAGAETEAPEVGKEIWVKEDRANVVAI
jgi:hypothetical protein